MMKTRDNVYVYSHCHLIIDRRRVAGLISDEIRNGSEGGKDLINELEKKKKILAVEIVRYNLVKNGGKKVQPISEDLKSIVCQV